VVNGRVLGFFNWFFCIRDGAKGYKTKNMYENQMLFEAILRLQKLRQVYSQTGRSQLAEVADKAISLALSPKREQNQFLSTNAFRNALSATNKAVKLRRFVALPSSEAECVYASQKEAYQAHYTSHPGDVMDQSFLSKKLVYIAAAVHPHGSEILAGMLNEIPVAETAAALNCSTRTVESVRACIRRAIKRQVRRSEAWK
jgi:hypothetical protein